MIHIFITSTVKNKRKMYLAYGQDVKPSFGVSPLQAVKRAARGHEGKQAAIHFMQAIPAHLHNAIASLA